MAFTPYDGTEATIGYPFLLLQTERPHSGTDPVNLGYILSVEIEGAQVSAGMEAANDLSFVREYMESHNFNIRGKLMQIADYELLQTLYNTTFGKSVGTDAYDSNLAPIYANLDLREVQVQVLCPDMSDMAEVFTATETTLAWGAYIPRAVLNLDYSMTLDGKTPLSINFELKALPQEVQWDDGASPATIIAEKDVLWIPIKPGATVDLSASGTGYSIKKWDS